MKSDLILFRYGKSYTCYTVECVHSFAIKDILNQTSGSVVASSSTLRWRSPGYNHSSFPSFWFRYQSNFYPLAGHWQLFFLLLFSFFFFLFFFFSYSFFFFLSFSIYLSCRRGCPWCLKFKGSVLFERATQFHTEL